MLQFTTEIAEFNGEMVTIEKENSD